MMMKKRFTLVCIICLSVLTIFSSAHAGDIYSQIKIFVPDKAALINIFNTGIDFEGSSGKIGGWMEFVAGDYELTSLKSKGIAYETVIGDLTNHYQKQLSRTPMDAMGFGFGSMGGFYTFTEVEQQLDSMAAHYPGLISPKETFGSSIEGRPIWTVMISNHPNDIDPEKPEVLYTAIHHAREPEGMMVLLYYMWWLLENYGTDAEATYLVNNRQLWFIPVVNPDGYVYNQTTNPGGGGLWRKNRRNNGNGSFGVDPNRNYGTMEMWNSPNGGSSTSTGSDTYRGTAPFSEPENAFMDAFMRIHAFKTCFNYHTYGNYLIYPWGYLSRENDDSLIYRDWTYEMTFANHYNNGTDLQTVSYSTRGNSDDYMYGDTTKPVTYAMTPEVGWTGFWPSSSEILPRAIEDLPQNKILAYLAGQYSCLVDYSIQDTGNGNGFLDRGETFALSVKIKNRGLDTASNLNVSVTSNVPSVQFASPSLPISSLNSQNTATLTFAGSVDETATVGIPLPIVVTISDPQGYQKKDTLNLFLGTPTTLLADSATDGVGNWTTGSAWGLTSDAHTQPNAFTDSPSGAYAPSSDNSMTTINQFNLSGFQYAELRFWTKWVIEPVWDFASVEISTNNGSSWTSLRSKLSHSGSGRAGSTQVAGTWEYESYTPGLTWVEQQIDLSSYVNQQVKLRFRMKADNGDQRDGFSVDDIRLYGYITQTDGSVSASIALESNWNLVSLPVTTTDGRIGFLFPHASGSAFAYASSSYQPHDTLEQGTGYWIRFPSAESVDILGFPVYEDTIPVVEGWNLIGSISVPVAVNDITSIPGGISTSSFFKYVSGSYAVADTLFPGGAYWVKVDQSASLILAQQFLASANTIRIARTMEVPPLPPGEMPSGKTELPKQFELSQNYPNPFNPLTEIHYALAEPSHVTLRIFNVLGEVVSTIVNEHEEAGYKTVVWNASRVGSGIYFYRLDATSSSGTNTSYSKVRKMLLVK